MALSAFTRLSSVEGLLDNSRLHLITFVSAEAPATSHQEPVSVLAGPLQANAAFTNPGRTR
jgi:hypothetical protein